MSIRIHWRPYSQETAHFNGGSTSTLEKVKQALGTTITKENVPTLYAMTIASDDPFYEEIAKVVEKVGVIEIWGEY